MMVSSVLFKRVQGIFKKANSGDTRARLTISRSLKRASKGNQKAAVISYIFAGLAKRELKMRQANTIPLTALAGNPRRLQRNLLKLSQKDPAFALARKTFAGCNTRDNKKALRVAGAIQKHGLAAKPKSFEARANLGLKLFAKAELEKRAQQATPLSGEIGFDFASALKKVAPAVLQVAKLTPYGAAADMALQMAPDDIRKGLGLAQGVQSLDPKSIVLSQGVKALASKGHPNALKIFGAMKASQQLMDEAELKPADKTIDLRISLLTPLSE